MNVLVVGEDGNKIGEMSLEKAKQLAADSGKSLVLVNAKENVYRVADIGKLKYEQKQKERNQRAQKRTHKVKEIKLNLTTEQHDIDIKVKKIREFLERGLKTKVVIQLHGRQEFCKDHGMEKMKDIINAVIAENIATVDKGPVVEDKSITIFLSPTK